MAFARGVPMALLLAVCAGLAQPRTQLLTRDSGFALIEERLWRTDNAGAEWSDVTPAEGAIAGFFFLDARRGWAMTARSELRIVTTDDGGATWSAATFEAATAGDLESFGGEASIHFIDANRGWLLLKRVSSANFSVGTLFATDDGGASWRRLPEPPAAGEIRFANANDGALTGGVEGEQVFTTHDGGRRWSEAPARHGAREQAPHNLAPRNLASDEAVVRAEFVDAREGWLVGAAGQCAGFKSDCRQETRLYRSGDGGETAIEITPPAKPHHSATRVSTAEGFDKCSADTAAHMLTWWQNGPFHDVNIYIGGNSRACSQTNLTAAWVQQMFAMGWRLIPTWVGPQAPCNNYTHKISTDTATADQQGADEADAAVDAAANLGLLPTVIYYDLEYYDNTNSSCHAAVKSFLNGWVREAHARGIVAGTYGSPYDIQGWAQIDHPPDAVWIAKWDLRDTVWGLTPLSDSLWPGSTRLHQYRGDHNETWGGVTFNIDSDVEHGPVAAPLARRLGVTVSSGR